jgi:alpha-tubulin suppressor-like RCC1 family protein
MNTTTRLRSQATAALTGLLAVLSLLAAFALSTTPASAQEGRIKAWGNNSYLQLGDTGSTGSRLTPATVAGLSNSDVQSLSAGYYHSLALLTNGTVESWGYNANGQLGVGTSANYSVPGTVTGLRGVVAIAAGGYHSLALLADGTVWAWGYNGYGELGDGTTTQRTNPVVTIGVTNARDVSAGSNHSLALLADGTVMAWGLNASGQLGDGTTTNRPLPIALNGAANVRAIAGGGDHTVILTRDGQTRTTGLNSNGQLGDGTTTNRTALTDPVSGLSSISLISAGTAFTLAA